MISATHAHTGPVPGRFLETPDESAGRNRFPGLRACQISLRPARADRGQRRRASRKLKPVSVTGFGRVRDVAFCRRFYMRDVLRWDGIRVN